MGPSIRPPASDYSGTILSLIKNIPNYRFSSYGPASRRGNISWELRELFNTINASNNVDLMLNK